MSTSALIEGPSRPQEAITPELVLVDPALALEARSRLPVRPPFPPERERPIAVAEARPTLESFPTGAPAGTEATSSRVAQPPPLLGYLHADQLARSPQRGHLRPAAAGFALGALAAAVAVGGGMLGGDRALLGTPSLAAPTPQATVPAARTPEGASEPPGRSTVDAPNPMTAAVAANDAPEPRAPTSSPPVAPPATSTSHDFVWPEVPGASGYEFQLFRGNKLVFKARVTYPRLELPDGWRFGGQEHRLVPGQYRWYVWAVSAVTGQPAPEALIQARLDVRD